MDSIGSRISLDSVGRRTSHGSTASLATSVNVKGDSVSLRGYPVTQVSAAANVSIISERADADFPENSGAFVGDRNVQVDNGVPQIKRSVLLNAFKLPTTEEGGASQFGQRTKFFFQKLGSHFSSNIKSWMPKFLMIGALAGGIIGFAGGFVSIAVFSAGLILTNPASALVAVAAAIICAVVGVAVGLIVGGLVCSICAMGAAFIQTVQYFCRSTDENVVAHVKDVEGELRKLIRKDLLTHDLSVKEKAQLDYLVFQLEDLDGIRLESLETPAILDFRSQLRYLSEFAQCFTIADALYYDEQKNLGLAHQQSKVVAAPIRQQAIVGEDEIAPSSVAALSQNDRNSQYPANGCFGQPSMPVYLPKDYVSRSATITTV